MTNMMKAGLSRLLSHKNALVRKGAMFALRAPRWWRRVRSRTTDFRVTPPVLANSVPKGGTHLLFQVVDGLPNCFNYGAFLSSMVSSFQFRERTPDNAVRFIRGIVPGEIVRGHLFYDPQSATQLLQRNVVHYFLFRDPRDVAVSEAHYLRDMNPWHRLHRYFAALGSSDEAIAFCISGFDPPIPGINFPNIGERYARYCGWMKAEGCLAIKFEDLTSEERPAVIRQMAEFYANACESPVDVEACAAQMDACIAPQKSHTFRLGKKGGWAAELTSEHRRLFDRVAGQLLIDLGYEPNHDWVTAEASATP